ncbi:MAG: hypothetical protein ACLFQU_05175 [Candidatus Kapaibacterium sp.]
MLKRCFSLLIFLISTLAMIAQEENKVTETENVLGASYSFNNPDDVRFLEFRWQYSDLLKDRILIPFMEYNAEFALHESDPGGYMGVFLGLKDELLSVGFSFIVIDFSTGIIGNINNDNKGNLNIGARIGLNAA